MDEVDDLQEFVQAVAELSTSRLGREVLSQRNITMRMSGNWSKIEIINFDEEGCSSFLLKCRLLIQNNERISLFRVWTLCEKRIANPDLFGRINPPRWMLNQYLDENSLFAVPGGGLITKRLLMDTFLYGSYAHLNRVHRRRFRQWQQDPKQFHVLKLEFVMGLQIVLKSAQLMAAVVSDWLAAQKT